MSGHTRSGPASRSQDGPDIEFASLWGAVRRSLKAVVLGAAVIGALTYGVLSLIAPRFTSEVQLAIAAKRTNPFPDARDRPGGDSVSPRLDKEAINTHAKALMAPDLLLKVARELELAKLREFNHVLGDLDTWTTLQRVAGLGGAPVAGREDDRVLGVVMRQIDVAPAKDSRFIPIRFTSADPELAAAFANKLAETYRGALLTAPVVETSEVVTQLTPKIEQLKKEVLEAEAEVDRFRALTDQFKAGSQATPINDQRMAALNDELSKAEAARTEIEARHRMTRELMQSGSVDVHPDVQKSPVIQGLIGQRVQLDRQVAEASASLLPAHPRMQQLNADVAGLKRQITAEVQKVVQSLEKDYRTASVKVDSIVKQLDALKSKVVDQSGNEAKLRSLDSTAKSKRAELERLQKQLEDNRTVVNIGQVPIEAQIISKARASNAPTYPKKGQTALLATAAAFILGLALSVTRGLVAGDAPQPRPARRRSEPHLVTANDSEPLSVRPAATAQPVVAMSAASRDRTATVAVPAIGTMPPPLTRLADALMARGDGEAGSRTLFTSETASTEVSAEALGFAEHLARAGKRVLLVPWSLSGRGLVVARTSLRRPGMIELLSGAASFEQVIGRLPGSDVHVIQPGEAPEDLQGVLDPDRLNLTFDALDEAYEHIVVSGTGEDAQGLFEAIEGRFDAAVVIWDGAVGVSAAEAQSRLLGFEVSDIDIVHLARRPKAGQDRGKGRTGKGSTGKGPKPVETRV